MNIPRKQGLGFSSPLLGTGLSQIRSPAKNLLFGTVASTSTTVKRKVFFSFHFEGDAWRAGQVRNMGLVDGNQPCTDNDWERVRRGGDQAINRWINGQLAGRTCTVVLIGSQTATRPWIRHEIVESWNRKMGVLGIHVHNLKSPIDPFGVTIKGANPFAMVRLNNGTGVPLSQIVPVYDPPGSTTQQVYGVIKSNLDRWIEHAIMIRNLTQ